MEFKVFKNENSKILKEYWLTPSEWDALDKTTVQEGDIYHIVGTIGEEDLSASLISKIENNAKINSSNTFAETQTFNKDIIIKGNIIQNGDTYKTHAEELYTKKDIIFTREGAVSTLGDNEYTGIQAVKYDGTNDGQLVFDKDGTARVGDVGDTQPLATRSEKEELVGGNLLQWDAVNNKIIDAGKSINELLVLKEPSPAQTEFVMVKQTPDGTVKQTQEAGTFTPSTNYPTYMPVLRGLQGQVKGQTALPADQTDLDLINRGELVSKLNNYEKSPNYALIEKIIVGYSVLETEPEDFTTNYSSYYKTNGKARNDIDFAYLALTEAETFETGKYYSKATESVAINRSGSGNYEPDGTRYAFNNVYAYIDSAANFKGSVFFQYYSIPSHVLLNRVYLDSSAAANTHIVQFSVDVKGNMAIAEAAALVDKDKSKTIGTSKNIVKDENFYLAGFYISPLQVDTTVLIYGVRI